MFGDADAYSLGERSSYADVGDIIKELTLQITVLIAIVDDTKTRGCLNVKWYYWEDHLAFVEEQGGKGGQTFEHYIDVFGWLWEFTIGDQ